MTEINNNYNNQPIFFGNKKKEVPMTNEEKMQVIMAKGREELCDMTEREVPENGDFKKVVIAFLIPDSNNEAEVSVESDKNNFKTQRYLSVGVHHKSRDRLLSKYILNGTKKEILDYLNDDKNQTEIIEKIQELSKKVDNYYNSL